ncbi:hypothetical protein MRX96_016242 [Rhipicephalus microplus]
MAAVSRPSVRLTFDSAQSAVQSEWPPFVPGRSVLAKMDGGALKSGVPFLSENASGIREGNVVCSARLPPPLGLLSRRLLIPGTDAAVADSAREWCIYQALGGAAGLDGGGGGGGYERHRRLLL